MAKLIAAVGVLVLAAAGSANGAASLSYSATASQQGVDGFNEAFSSNSFTSAASFTASVSAGGGSAVGAFDFGALKVATGASIEARKGARANITATWQDTFTLTSPTASTGYILGDVLLRGVQGGSFVTPPDALGQSYLSASLTTITLHQAGARDVVLQVGIDLRESRSSLIGHPDIIDDSVRYQTFSSGSTYGAQSYSSRITNGILTSATGAVFDPFQAYGVMIPFATNRPIQFTMQVQCDARAGSGALGFCALDQSVYWTGFSGVFDALGHEVTDYALTSASGFDFAEGYALTSGAPEPATWALLTAGFGLGGVALRRREGRQAA